ncbi:MAG: M23 family metallopeptidase [Chitinispirillales bacterium]|jgi:murein DD-endopeptidase MepM/ murein hydrolase activator NlpD|nr:M23 family metallopeptidase [Chitinispirillales bacterium]
MKKRNKQNNHYTFMFCPEGRGSPFTLRIHRYTIYLTVISALFIITSLIILIYKNSEIAMKLQLFDNLVQENIRLREHNNNLEISSQKMANIDSMTAYLHRLANITDMWGSASSGGAIARAVTDRSNQEISTITHVDTERAAADAAGFAASVPNIMPVDGWITKHFSEDTHKGIDIAAAHGTPIRVTAMGMVEEVRFDKYLGLTVEVRHDNGFQTRYSHCSQVLVSPGDRVNRGQTIALVGNTGRSTAPHVHYEIFKDERHVDPMNFIGTANER